jgi:hypothetical protein
LHPYQRVWYQRLTLFEQNTKLPRGKWCIFEQIAGLMRDLEAKGVLLPDTATIAILNHYQNYDTIICNT